VLKMLVPPVTDVGMLVPEATERISNVMSPEELGVYTLARTPRSVQGKGMRSQAAGVVETVRAVVSPVSAMTAVRGSPESTGILTAAIDAVEDTEDGVAISRFVRSRAAKLPAFCLIDE
jgi:hypothetical protein